MFENGDLDLDGEWFTDDLSSDLSITKQKKCEQPTTSTHNNSDFNVRTRKLIRKVETHTSPKRKIVLKRKFPGPAGLFPEGEGPSKLVNDNHSENDSSLILNTQLLCSQNSTEMFERLTWLDMSKDFNDGTPSLLNKYNIQWINNNMPLNLKVPFLAAIIKEVKNTSNSPIFVLADLTGVMEAVISTELYDEYDKYLSHNSVIILKEFSILLINNVKHYISINTDNLVRIYSCKDMPEDEVRIVHIQQTSNENIKATVEEFINKSKRFDPVNAISCNIRGETERNENIFNNTISQNMSWSSNNVSTSNVLSDKNFNDCNEIMKNKIESTQSKFKFKDASLKTGKNKTAIDSLNPSAKNVQNIFDQANSSLDLDLCIDDFQDNFIIPDHNEFVNNNSENVYKNNRNQELNFLHSTEGQKSPSKKQKLNMFKYKSIIEKIPNARASTSGDIKENLKENRKSTNKIDCSQISVISTNNENFDVEEVFCDLDAADLFGDF